MFNKKIIFLPIILTSFFGILGCQNGDTPSVSEVFTAFSTAKVCKNPSASQYFEKLDPEINLDLMKNESEASQIIFKMSKNVSSFTVSKTSLEDGRGHFIDSSNVSVYMQQYMTLTSSPDQNPSFTAGDEIPDFLLPVEYAVQCHVNSFKGNVYQGFVIDVKTSSDTVPGKYYGSVTFNFDGTVYKAPITANVWDIEYTGHRNFQSSFLLYKSWLIGGEYSTSEELVDSYVDFMTDYKCNTLVVEPVTEIRKEGGMAKYVEKQLKLFNENNNYSSIPLPIISIPDVGYDFNRGRIDNLIDRSSANAHQITTLYFYDFISSILANCTNDINYFPYAYYYLTSFDEMDMYRGPGSLYERGMKFFAKGGDMDLLIDHVISLLKNSGAFSHLSAYVATQIEDSIREIPRVVPVTTFDEDIVEDLNLTACPYFSLLDNGLYSSRFEKQREENANGYLWTYTCVGPTYPYPTFHLGDYNLGSRTTGWTCKKNNINGYLYYAYNIFDEQNNSFDVGFVDPYTSPIRNASCPGDGYLVYPGKKYGSKKPFPSNRLLCFRDGMDDYDLLEVFETELNKKSLIYGTDFDFQQIMSSYYDKIVTNVKYIENDRNIFEVRKQIFQLIRDLKGIDGFVQTKELNNDKIVSKFYNLKNNLVIDGAHVSSSKCGNGFVFTREDNVDSQAKTIKVNTPYLTRDVVIDKSGYVNDFTSTDLINVSESGEVSVENKICHVSLNPMIYPDSQDTKMAVRSISLINGSIKGIRGISVEIKNTCSLPLALNCTLLSTISTNVGSLYLFPNQTNTFHFGFGRVGENSIKNARGIMFKCDNYNDKVDAPFGAFKFDINSITYYA